jgi:hypothetical protein
MKKTRFIILLLLMGWIGITATAQPVQLRIADLTGTAGTLRDVPVHIDNSVTGMNILSCQFQISFNSSIMSFVSVEIAGTMIQPWGTPSANVSPAGNLNIAGAGTSALTGSGTLFIIRFQCIAAGYSALNFNGGATNNYFNEGLPLSVYDNGSLNISPAPFITVSPNSALLSVGETQQFTVSGGTPPYTWSVTNPAVATISTSGLLTATSAGFTKVSVQDNTGIIDQTDTDIEIRALKLTLPAISALQGTIVEIPVTTTSLTGLGIIGGNIRITFNQNIISPVGYNVTGTLLSGYSDIQLNPAVPGQLNLAFAGTTALTGTGVLIYLRFSVSTVNTGSSTLAFTEAIFNETIPAKTVNGTFNTINFPVITVTPNTAILVAGDQQQFNASGGTAPYTWNTSDNSVAIINNAGMLTALKSGIIQVTATDNLGASGSSGNITIYDTWVTIPNVNAVLTSTYDIPVMMGSLPPGQSVFSIQGTISYLSPELTALDIITTGTMTDGWSSVEVVSGNKITFALAGTISFNTPGIMFKVRFQLNPQLTQGEVAYVNIDNIMLNEGIPLPRTANGSITGSAGKVLNLTAFLEGLYTGPNTMAQANDEFGPHFPLPTADQIDVELHNSANYGTIVYTAPAVNLSTSGSASTIVPTAYNGSYYITIRHRNSVETTTANPVSFAGGSITYNFSTAASQAYGSNQTGIGGVFMIYGGDVNQDGVVDTGDITPVDNDAANFAAGYLDTDVNGDGITDTADMTIVDNNAAGYVGSVTP